MTTPENQETAPPERVTRPEAAQTQPNRSATTAAAADAARETPAQPQPNQAHVRDPDVLKVNEAVASTVRSAYDVLGETVAQGRKAAEQFRVGAYNMRDVPEDLRHMAGNLLGLARQLSSATFDICEALLRQADSLSTPPPPGSTHVPPFQAPKGEQAAPKPAAAPAKAPTNDIHLTVNIDGHASARAHTTTLARPQTPTGTEQFGCDGLSQRGSSAAPITAVAFAAHPDGRGLVARVHVPPEHPKGVYVGAVYCATQDLPLGQLVIEID